VIAGRENERRQLNGPQASGRDYSNLSAPLHNGTRDNDVAIPLAELVRNPSSEAWSRLHLVAYRAMAIWTQWDNIYEGGWKPLDEANGAENFARAYRTALLILAAALLFFLRGERLFILGSLISYVALRTCFLAFLGERESRYLVPMLPSMELVLIAAIPITLRSLTTTRSVDPDDQIAREIKNLAPR
jgi:hypothetical protein